MNDVESKRSDPAWMGQVLRLAGVYNLAWGLSVVLYPSAFFQWAGMELPRYPQIWQCVGMIVGVFGVGYLIASSHPLRHWPIVWVGLLGKICGPAGFAWAAICDTLPWSWGLLIIFNDLFWWLPFTAILHRAWRTHSDTSRAVSHSMAICDSCVSEPTGSDARGAIVGQANTRDLSAAWGLHFLPREPGAIAGAA